MMLKGLKDAQKLVQESNIKQESSLPEHYQSYWRLGQGAEDTITIASVREGKPSYPKDKCLIPGLKLWGLYGVYVQPETKENETTRPFPNCAALFRFIEKGQVRLVGVVQFPDA